MVLAFVWICIDNIAGAFAFAFAAIYGFFSGAITTVTAPIDVAMCPSNELVGARMGMLLSPWALGLLVGTPIGGANLSGANGWLGLQIFTGTVLATATVLAIAVSFAKYGLFWRQKC